MRGYELTAGQPGVASITGHSIEIRLLGPVEAQVAGRPLALKAARQRAVLARLALEPGRVVAVDALIDGLWGTEPPPAVRSTLKSLVSRLRASFLQAGADGAVLRAVAPGYLFDVDPECVDVHRFEALSARARAVRGAEPAATVELLKAALQLWRGAALSDLLGLPFAGTVAARLQEARSNLVEDLAQAELDLGRNDAVVRCMRAHVAEDPFRERGWALLMTALYRAGRQAAALRAYQDVRRALRKELALEPGPELRRLEEQILLQRVDASDVPDRAEGPNRLPVVLSSFVGRAAERRSVVELLRRRRLVTLTGEGGVGKTRLALEVAGAAATEFPHGVCFVDLGPVAESDLIVRQFASALGFSAVGSDERVGSVAGLARMLDRYRILLVIDNCEHLPEAAGEVITGLLRGGRELVVLATSRQRLGVVGETVWRVPPLSLPPPGTTDPALVAASDAGALFCARAGALHREFALDADNAGAITRICYLLDGIPLALELAAARVGTLHPAALADRLDEGLMPLISAATDAPGRHRTLEACLDWGHGLLTRSERDLLARLSVCAGGFDLAAVDALADTRDGDVIDLLTRLVDSCWIEVRPGADAARFRLTETVRRYAAAKLARSGQAEAAAARHLDHFLELASGYRGAPLCAPRRWLNQVAAERENLSAALVWSSANGDGSRMLRLAGYLFPFWSLDGRFAEGRAWLERALAQDPGPPGAARAWARVALGVLVGQLGATERCEELLRAVNAEVADTRSIGYATGYLGAFALQQGQPQAAADLLTQARHLLVSAGDDAGEAWCEFNLGFARLAEGDRMGAAQALRRSLDLLHVEPSDVLRAHAGAALGSLLAMIGAHSDAAEHTSAAVAAARRLGLRHVLVMALVRAAEAEVFLGRLQAARSALVEALALLDELGGRMWVDDALQLAGVLLARGGATELAVRLLAAGNAAAPGDETARHRPLQVLVDITRTELAATVPAALLEYAWLAGALLPVMTAVPEALAGLAAPSFP